MKPISSHQSSIVSSAQLCPPMLETLESAQYWMKL